MVESDAGLLYPRACSSDSGSGPFQNPVNVILSKCDIRNESDVLRMIAGISQRWRRGLSQRTVLKTGRQQGFPNDIREVCRHHATSSATAGLGRGLVRSLDLNLER